MATNLQGSSHRPRAVGFRLRNRKDFIYEKKLSDQKSNYEKKIEKTKEETSELKNEIRSLQKLLKAQNEQIAQLNKKIDDLLEVITKLTERNNNSCNNSPDRPDL